MLGKLKKHSKGYSLYVKDVEIAIYDTERTERPLYSLSKENCDDIFGIVDVDKLSKQAFPCDYNSQGDELDYFERMAWKNGFLKATELNNFLSEEVVEDDFKGLRDCIQDQDIAEFYINLAKTMFCEIKPTEMEVEIEMGYAIYPANLPKENEERPTMMPKRDENGCLILKRV